MDKELSEEHLPEEIVPEGEKFDENQLLQIATTEGLVENLEPAPESENESESATPVELSDADQAMIMASIETILFMSDKPVSLPKLRSILRPDVPLSMFRELMARLRAEFASDHRGVEIAEVALGFQLRTKPHMASVLRKMVKTQPLKLSPTTMEVLAVIAYKQPVTKDELDQIRGVDSGYVLRNLMEKRLVRIAGRSDLPGKPMVYGTTHEFLELFNLKDARQLPPLHEVEAMVAASEVGFEEKTQAVMDEFGKMVANSTKVLFDDSQIDEELESLRSEIASIPTSTAFIDEQKAKEKLDAKLAELATQGLTLDAEGNIVPIGSINEAPQEHRPSPELEAAAAEAQWERHAAMIAEAEASAVNVEAVVVQQVVEETVIITAPETAIEPEEAKAPLEQ